jgi:broad specificity phosphatase PhoE
MSQSEILQVYIARHGQTDLNLRPEIISGRSTTVPLNEVGRQQSRELGSDYAAAGIVPSVVYSSPALRPLQTAAESLAVMGCALEPIIDHDLQEIEQGQAEGMLRTDFYDEAQREAIRQDPRNWHPLGGESINDVLRKQLRFLGRAAVDLRENDGTIALVYGHGFATRVLAGDLLGWSVEEIREYPTPNCSVSLFECQQESWRVVYVGRRLLLPDSVK